jgi:acetyltransferase-like isoleucine patch superfamily enzyme
MMSYFFILKGIVKQVFYNGFRQLYWLYRLSKINGVRGIRIEYPVCVEGKGKISLGSSSVVEKRSGLKVGDNARLVLGADCLVGSQVDLRVGVGASLIGHKQCSIGRGTRLYINNQWTLGNNVHIATNCAIFSREQGLFGRLVMNNNSHISDNCIIDISDDVIIGEGVAIGPNCIFYTHDHEYNDLSLPAWSGGKTTGAINIGDNAWLGSGVTVLPGVTIGRHVVVGAGSVVTKNIPNNTVWAGVPARHIKSIG